MVWCGVVFFSARIAPVHRTRGTAWSGSMRGPKTERCRDHALAPVKPANCQQASAERPAPSSCMLGRGELLGRSRRHRVPRTIGRCVHHWHLRQKVSPCRACQIRPMSAVWQPPLVCTPRDRQPKSVGNCTWNVRPQQEDAKLCHALQSQHLSRPHRCIRDPVLARHCNWACW